MAALKSEVEVCRRLTIGCGAFTIAGILFIAPYIIPLFGNFGGALGFLTLLAIGAFVSSFYATSDRLLIIAGHANVALTLTASSFAVLTITPFVTAPWLGPIAVPAAMIASAILFNPIVAVRVRQLFGIHTLALPDLVLMVCGSAMLAIAAINGSRLWAAGACAVLCLIGVYLLATAIRQSQFGASGARALPVPRKVCYRAGAYLRSAARYTSSVLSAMRAQLCARMMRACSASLSLGSPSSWQVARNCSASAGISPDAK